MKISDEKAKRLTTWCGFGLGFAGTFLVWQSAYVFATLLYTGISLMDALFDPALALRVLAGMCAFLAGMSALLERNGGAWLAGLSAFAFATMVVILSNQEAIGLEAWRNEAIGLIMISALSLALVVARRNAPAPFSDKARQEPAPDEPSLQTA